MFGIRLRLLRWQAGLTQAELGARLNLTAGALGMYEHGRRRPSLSIIPEIADEFSVSCDFLLSGKGRNERETMLELMASMFAALDQNTDETRRQSINGRVKRTRKPCKQIRN